METVSTSLVSSGVRVSEIIPPEMGNSPLLCTRVECLSSPDASGSTTGRRSIPDPKRLRLSLGERPPDIIQVFEQRIYVRS